MAAMCNLYDISIGPQAVLQFTRAMVNRAGNMEPGKVYPDYPPIVRNGEDGQRELVRARWGMPTPPKFLKGKADSGVTNIRNVTSPHWRRWLGLESRCVVPATSFSEYGKVGDPETKRLASLVCACRGCTAVRLCGPMDAMAWRAQGQGG